MSNNTQPDNALDIAPPEDGLPEDYSQGFRTQGNVRRVVVDRQGCIGARSCAIVSGLAFQMDEENLAYVPEGTVDQADEETLKLGAQSCPVLAIHLYDKEGKKVFPES